MKNRLAGESSPYLLQHADNPVDWYPWGEEALALARESNRPVLLSIGYAACHWCHVMAHESFEDAATAELMNRYFVNVKVDREERPDLDSIYMAAVTAMTGHGGWPMTVFLTPEGKPFYAGTYFPPEPRHGLVSFRQLLKGIAEAWVERPQDVAAGADSVVQHLRQSAPPAAGEVLAPELLDSAVHELKRRFDREWGGFGAAPKFPQPMVLEFLLREHLRSPGSGVLAMVTTTLRRMASGGMYDQLGGGFARYSTDREWLVPHFEKMLYDNAQLARLYLHAWQVTGESEFRRVTEETLDYLLREMRHRDGGFYSSQDADSEGVEGKFFVWNADEIRRELGDAAELFMRVHGVSQQGNWEGSNVLHLAQPVAEAAAVLGMSETEAHGLLEGAKRRLFQLRSTRIWPGLDDKVITAWNGLALGALAEAGRVLGRADYLQAAAGNAAFIQRELRHEDGRLLRTWKAGAGAKYNAYLEDYAFLAEGLLALYEADFDPRWYAWAEELGRLILRHFADPEGAGFFDTSDDHEALLLRPRDTQDNATPSGGARAAMVLYKLGLYSGAGDFIAAAERALSALGGMLRQYPLGFGEWLNVASLALGRPCELALIGSPAELEDLRAVVNAEFRPWLVVAAGQGDEPAPRLLQGRTRLAGLPTAWLCERFACQAPVSDAAALRELLDGVRA